MTQNEIKNLDSFIYEIIITLFQNVLQQTSASYPFHKSVPKRLISPYLPSYIAHINLKYTEITRMPRDTKQPNKMINAVQKMLVGE